MNQTITSTVYDDRIWIYSTYTSSFNSMSFTFDPIWRVHVRTIEVFKEAEKLNLKPGLYGYYDLNQAQLEFVKSLGFNMCTGDAVEITWDNLEWLEYKYAQSVK